jgi:NADPH2:quinone reductase
MRTVEVRAFGGPECVDWVDAPTPVPGPGEVLLRLEACGLNHADLLMREGDYLGGPRPPFRPGMEAAGLVEAIGGEGDDRLQVGMRVAAVAGSGLQATHAVVPAAACVPIPDELSWAQAAALPVAGLTAYHALVTVARAEPGEVVLIHGAAGGVGTAAVGIARCLGLRVVATASTAEKRARVRELGAEVAVGYGGFEKAVRELTGGRGPDVVVEMIGGDVLRRSLRLLPPLGRLVVVGMVSRQAPAVDTVQLLFRSQSVLGFHLRSLLERRDLIAASMRRLLSWIAAGELGVEVGRVLPLDEIRRAHELLAGRRVQGKIVLAPPHEGAQG